MYKRMGGDEECVVKKGSQVEGKEKEMTID